MVTCHLESRLLSQFGRDSYHKLGSRSASRRWRRRWPSTPSRRSSTSTGARSSRAPLFTGLLIKNGIAISMDGKGAWRDNVFVERLWRSVKYEEVYLRAYDSVPRPAHRLAAISTSTMGADLTRGMYGLKAITSTVAPQAGTAGHRNSSRLPKDFRKELHSRILLGSSQ